MSIDPNKLKSEAYKALRCLYLDSGWSIAEDVNMKIRSYLYYLEDELKKLKEGRGQEP